MPAIDWTNQGLVVALAVLGEILILGAVVLYFRPIPCIKRLALAAGIGGLLATGIALGLHLLPAVPPVDHGKPADAPSPEPSSQVEPALTLPVPELVARFRKTTPAERMALLARLPDSAAAWYTVQRGDVDTVVERGTLESADYAVVVVKVRAQSPNMPVGIITWVVDNGTMVKKGQLLLKLDYTELKERLKAQQIVVEQKKAELIRIQKQKQAETARRAVQSALDTEMARAKDLESDIANCKMYAPRDGPAIYYVQTRGWGGAPPSLVGVDETVKEGQKLLTIPDLSKMGVDVCIHESLIPLVHSGQTASVRVDAFPGRVLSGKVPRINNLSDSRANVKILPVTIALTDEKLGLKAGMSAEVRIPVEPRRHVPRVPVQALIIDGHSIVCFVKSGEEIQERSVIVGLRDKAFVEIEEGVKEGDRVLRDPQAVLWRMSWPRQAEDAQGK